MLIPNHAFSAVIERDRDRPRPDADARAAIFVSVTPAEFCGWLSMAAPGDTTIYYHGQISRDRCRSTTMLPEPERHRLIALARQALVAAEDGRVHLLQRKHGDGSYSYIAVKAKRRPGVGGPHGGPRSERNTPRRSTA